MSRRHFSSLGSLTEDIPAEALASTTSITRSLPFDADHNLIGFLELAQRLRVDLVPVTWETPRGLLGRGGQAQVNQSLISVQTSFAFKRYNSAYRSNVFREAIHEMAILSHPLLQTHPGILALKGVSLDVVADDDVRPVLILEKSNHGDLRHFMTRHGQTILSLEDRRKICIDIGNTIQDMHDNGKTFRTYTLENFANNMQRDHTR